jgi:hypothetical protein
MGTPAPLLTALFLFDGSWTWRYLLSRDEDYEA